MSDPLGRLYAATLQTPVRQILPEDDDDEAELICCFRWRSFSMRRAAIFAALGVNENAIGLA